MLGVHFMLCYVVLFYGTESAKSDMKSYVADINAVRFKLVEHLGRKMQPRGRRGGRAELL